MSSAEHGIIPYIPTTNAQVIYRQFLSVISDKMVYNSKRESAYRYSSQFQWDGIGKEFEQFIDLLS